MALLMLPSFVLCLSVALTAPDDLLTRLEELSSPSADERARAERWLAVHVTSEDFPLLAETVLDGDAEVRRRMAHALGSDDASLDLAVLFALEDDPLLYGVGEGAIGEMLSRWSDGYDAPPLTGNELARALRDLSRAEVQPEFLEVDLAAPLAVTLDRLARLGRVPVGICIDPSVAERARRRIESSEPMPFVGTWTGILFALAAAHQVDLEGVGLESDDPRGGGVFVRFAPRGTAVGPERRRVLVARWCREAFLGDEPRRAAAARALAATRWPGVLAWLDVRWRQHGERSARDGVLLAAARGRRVPALGRAEVVRDLVVDAAAVAHTVPVARAEERLNRILHALSAGSCLGAGGVDLAAVLLDGFETSDALQRELRLAALEGMGCADADGVIFDHLRAILAAETSPPVLLRQALRTWVVLAPFDEVDGSDDRGDEVDGRELRPLEPPAIARPAALLGSGSTAWSPEECLEVSRLLVVAGCEPPSTFRDPADLGAAGLPPTLLAQRLAVLAWW
ncbi:MAG: hypothetical protein O7B99_00415, partial [Planctomycetota bacterium]|nr:hypothetical protein [Planctomycetota bacterium]